MNTIDYAKFYISNGWQVLPLANKDKRPMIPWKNGGSTDLATVTGWFDMWQHANIGIVTGKKSGIVVLDVDHGHGGEDTLLVLMDKYGVLPETPISRTGGGGLHYIFQHPDFDISNSAGKIGQGLDVRGDGGQICAPPSIHPSGNRYKWDDNFKPSKLKPAPMPNWLLELLQEKKTTAPITTDEQGYYIDGTRNSSLVSLAGTMRRRNMTQEAIYSALQVENKQRCFPPLPELEVENIVKSIIRYQPAALPITQKQFSISIQKPTSSNDALDELAQEIKVPAFVGTGLSSLDDKLGGLPRGYLTLLVARPGMGKTTLAMQIARNVAVSGHKALFISLEMLGSELWVKAALGIAEVAWKDFSNGEVPAGTKERIQKDIIPTLQKGLGDRLLIYDKDQNCTTTEMINTMIEETKPDLVIIDHLAYLSDEHENEIKRLGMICRRLRTIAQNNNVALLLLHHANRSTDDRKNQTKEPRMADIRGSGEIEQAADIIMMPYIPSNYEMREEKPRVSLTYIPVVKNRIGQVGIHIVLYFDGLGQWFYRKNELPVNLIGREEENES
jgi:RecA/RadA recombinase